MKHILNEISAKKWVDWNFRNYLLTIITCSSIIFPSPITTGPASAIIVAQGWITVIDPTVTSPRNFASLQTIAPWYILTLKIKIALSRKNENRNGMILIRSKNTADCSLMVTHSDFDIFRANWWIICRTWVFVYSFENPS